MSKDFSGLLIIAYSPFCLSSEIQTCSLKIITFLSNEFLSMSLFAVNEKIFEPARRGTSAGYQDRF